MIDMDGVKLQDCIDMRKYKKMSAIINDGKLVGFEYEESTVSDGKSEQC